MIDTTTGTVKLKAMFPNTDGALFPSQFVNARLLVDTLHNVTLIPTPAIQRNAQGAFVYVIGADQTASIHPVTPGVTDGTMTQVEGIEPGSTLAITGFDKLQDGSKIIVRQPSQNAPQGSGKPGGHPTEAPSNGGSTGKKGGGSF
jgi:multidrug efflux system membrane fusion protein